MIEQTTFQRIIYYCIIPVSIIGCLLLIFNSIHTKKKTTNWLLVLIIEIIIILIIPLLIMYLGNVYLYKCTWKCKQKNKKTFFDNGCYLKCPTIFKKLSIKRKLNRKKP